MSFQEIGSALRRDPQRWLVTGAAGFIGSHIVETLLDLGQSVVGLDDFSTGRDENIRHAVGDDPERRNRFTLLRGDIRSVETCDQAARGVAYVVHQAAMVSVPMSMADPVGFDRCNVGGFLNVIDAARRNGARRFVYASSCAVYGDTAATVLRESAPIAPLSPYAASKRINEVYADTYQRAFGLTSVGLRYFNVYGPRQDPGGPYAAVIPVWMRRLERGEPCTIYGDGSATRDFVFVKDVAAANIAAAAGRAPESAEPFNIATGSAVTIKELFFRLRDLVAERDARAGWVTPVHAPARQGDILHSRADVSRARQSLGFEPSNSLTDGLRATIDWYWGR